jgi:hypothetical protein
MEVVSEMRIAGGTEVRARIVATPVLEWASARERAGSVLSVGRDVAYVGFPGVVVALERSGMPLMPNGVSLGPNPVVFDGSIAPGDTARLHRDGIEFADLQVGWPHGVVTWEPRVHAGPWPAARVLARGQAILARADVEGSRSPEDSLADEGVTLAQEARGRGAIEALFSSLRVRDPGMAGRAAEAMLGLGAGLTPEGDDLLGAVAVTVAVLGTSVGIDGSVRRQLIQALVPRTVGRTTALSATLLALAAGGRPLRPVGLLLDLDDERGAATAIDALRKLGHTTGRVYLIGIGAAMAALAER